MLEVERIEALQGGLQVLWEVSLTVKPGEIVALVGPNGAGKSTLLGVISGLIRAARGRVRFLDQDIETKPPHRIAELGLCQVPEGRGLFPQMSVLENLEMGCFLEPARQRKGESLELVYNYFPVLQTRSRQKAGTLSGGEQQMVAIGRGIMSRPKLLILDEPSWGLSPLLSQAIFDVVRRINRAGVAVLLVEQNVHLSLELAHRGYVMENGRIVGEGRGDELLADRHVQEAYLGQAGASEGA